MQSEDGAVLSDIAPATAYAKFALRKGLPREGQRTLAIENDPHTVDDFDGVISEGYGKGEKRLLYSGLGIVKLRGRTFPAKVNYHRHLAAKAGLHYDLVAEGVPSGLQPRGKESSGALFELNIPNGEYKGRYSFVGTPQGIIVVRMKDEGLLLPKPEYRLKEEDFLATEVRAHPELYEVEQKLDGSLANVNIGEHRATLRSHRENAKTYYDKLPTLEFIQNTNPSFLQRFVFRPEELKGTVLKGELVHVDGASRVSGILNALPANARAIQNLRGPVHFYAWEILKFKGKDVSKLSYDDRREIRRQAIEEIRRFNKYYHDIPSKGPVEDPVSFYERIIAEPLPFGEGVVVKRRDAKAGEVPWPKVKQRDVVLVRLIGLVEGRGKYLGSAGTAIVQDPTTGGIGELGSFAITDEKRQWIWDNKDKLLDPTNPPLVKAKVMAMTDKGAPRAGVFLDFHEGESDLLMYSESLAGGDQKLAEQTKYKLISSARQR